MARNKRGFSIAQNILMFTILIIILSTITITILQSLTYSNSATILLEDSSNEINKQVMMNYENYIDSVLATTNYIQNKTVEYGLLEQNDELDYIFKNAVEQQTDIVTIVLYDISGNIIAKSTTQTMIPQDITIKDFFVDAIYENTIYHFSSPHQQELVQNLNEQVITVSKMVDYYDNNNRSSGILIVDINTTRIVELSNNTNLGDGGHIVILNSDDSLIYSSNASCSLDDCPSKEIIKSIIIGSKQVELEDKDMFVNVNTLGNTRWQVGTFINIDILNQTRTRALYVSIVIFGVTLLTTIIASVLISRRISNPIYKLQKHMKIVEKGNFYKKIEVSGQKEVVDLGNSFNILQDEISTLMDTLLIEQREKRKSEFRALQTQINPHFLYNTLDSIVYLSENGENKKVQEMVIALSRFFRISISRGKNIISVKEELEHAKNYLLIQQIRYHEKFSFAFEIEEESKKCAVVKLIIQPLIENAIYHGINTEFGEGKIIIRSFLNNDKLILEVENDGYGITEDKIAEMYQSIQDKNDTKSVGLKNVYQRVRLYYGDESNFIIKSELDENTIIRLELPIEEVKK